MNKLPIKDRFLGSIALMKRKIQLFWRRVSSKKVLAVYDDELEDVLNNLGLLSKIENNEINCHRCNCKITKENLGVIKNENGAIHIFCISTSCNS